jgi:serine/threonine-protein kinase HipA
MQRMLDVFIQGAHVGELRDERGDWCFRYSPVWVTTANCCALSPGIPLQREAIVDRGTIRPVQSYFEGLLPDVRARTQLAEVAQIDAADSLSLLAHFGAKSAVYPLGDYPSFHNFGPLQRTFAQAA